MLIEFYFLYHKVVISHLNILIFLNSTIGILGFLLLLLLLKSK